MKPRYIVAYQSGGYVVLQLDKPSGFYYSFAEAADSVAANRIAAVLNRAEEG